ncbi:unnamed protein product [Allacma fusca]|uniref:RING-type E3 ubiquitin transferase n=1 Tax=Allacma fusca TaxID=39272 RepID=A0A8J2JUZ0_9HEXA|nr:unnamed protein product [Allacma fusca]
MVIESDEEEQQIETSETVDNLVEIPPDPPADPLKSDFIGITSEKVEFSIDDDISQLVPPTFSTLTAGPPQPMVDLDWFHNYNPSAEKVPNPNVHMCVACLLPIRLYGRLIPCKHVFCYSCAKKQADKCSRCNEKVHRIEQAHLGSVHMCHHEGSRYGFDGCRRTYLSQRDLQAHINHRHKPRNIVSTSGDGLSSSHGALDSSLSSYQSRQSIPVVHSSRSNLISVPLQGTSSRVKPDSQSMCAPSPENSTLPSSTGSRYDRKPPFSQHYSRSSWQFRQF